MKDFLNLNLTYDVQDVGHAIEIHSDIQFRTSCAVLSGQITCTE